MPELIGQTHLHLLQWLSQDWLQEGPPICFLEGFSGVGKSSLAYSLNGKVEGHEALGGHGTWTAVKVDMPEGTNAVNELLLGLAEELSWAGHDKLADAVKEGKSLEEALKVVLRRPILIVVDEFQRALLPDTGQPIQPLEQIFQKIANRPNIPGRLLLLTNRLIEPGARWSESYAVKRLPALEVLEAEQLLRQRLQENGKENHVPIERRRDVVNWLGRNPQAIGVLVGCLENESLDDLIGSNPESWELKDREVSEDFLGRLEKKLLERILSHLPPEITLFLTSLAVYRKPFKRKAMESLLDQPKKEFPKKSAELTNRFLLEHPDRQWYALHPVARSIVLQRLKEDLKLWKMAHSKAADFYMKPFFKPDIQGSKLGGSFLEARYHLVQSGREKELGTIAKNFEQYLKATTRNKRSIPKQREELDEDILVFSVLAEAINSEELECYLVWLLQARRKEGDLEQALHHAKQATGVGLGLRVTSWLLRVDLESQLCDLETALSSCQEGINRVGIDEDVTKLYGRCTELLKNCDRLDDAMKLLENGIQQTPSGLGLTALYQQGKTLLTQAKEMEQAEIWLKQGIRQVAPEHGLVKLYQDCAELLSLMGQMNEAVSLLEEGIERLPPEHGLNQLYKFCGDLLVETERIPEAVKLLKEGIHNIPSEHDPFVLYERCTELLIQSGNSDKAVELLQESLQILPSTQSKIPLYERWGNLLSRTGQKEEAITLLQQGIYTIPAIRGPVKLYLACGKLLAEGGRIGDAVDLLEQGIQRIPSDRSDCSLYNYCAELLEQLGEIDQATDILKAGIESICHLEGRYKLYKHCAELLEKSDQIDEAAHLLKEGISRFPYDENCKKLYLACSTLLKRHSQIEEAIVLLQKGVEVMPDAPLYVALANLLAQSDRVDEAITLLQKAVEVMPHEHLYLALAKLLAQSDRVDEALKILKDGLQKVPANQKGNIIESFMFTCIASQNQSELVEILARIEDKSFDAPQRVVVVGQVLLAQLQQNWQQAAKIGSASMAKFPTYLTLMAQVSFSWLCAGDLITAQKTLHFDSLKRLQHNPILWLKALIELKQNDLEAAKISLENYLDRPIQVETELAETFLLSLWDTPNDFQEKVYLTYSFPTLPPTITGFNFSVTRDQFSPPVLQNYQFSSNPMTLSSQKNLPEQSMKNTTSRTLENSDEQGTHSFCVFLSHSSADKAKILEVIEAFKKANIPYWVDHEQINFGDGISVKIEEGLQKSKYVVACLSENLSTSGWCRAEYGAILHREFSGDPSKRVIPLSLDGSKNIKAIPLLLSDKLRADFTDQTDFSKFIQFLSRSK